MTEHSSQPWEAFAELGRIDLRLHDTQSVLDRVAHLAKAVIPGADDVSVSLITNGRPTSPVYTGQLAIECDESQYAEGDGPCLEAATRSRTVYVPDLSEEARWGDYPRHAVAKGAGSSLSLPLQVDQAGSGALNIYATTAYAFASDSVGVAERFATYASVAIGNAQLYGASETLATQLREAMESRAVIEQAKGCIMATRRCTADEAFAVLVQASSRSNRKLRDIAGDIVTGATNG